MKVAVTGATGFLGAEVVARLRIRRHRVLAFARPAQTVLPGWWADDPEVAMVRHDLRQGQGLVKALGDVDAVIHLAAAKAGDFHSQFAATVVGTENLLQAMSEARIRRLVLVSSFSVYDYARLRAGDLLDEAAPVTEGAADRDVYAQTKTIQERLVAKAGAEGRFDVTIVRPGMVYGPGNLWNPCLGIALGQVFVRVGGRSRMPLTFVENCAEGLVAAVERREAVGEIVNVVDDHLPTRRAFSRALEVRQPAAPAVVAVSWRAAWAVASTASAVNRRVFGGAARLPGFLVPAQVAARFAPLRYSNEHAKRVLDWSPRYSFAEAIERSVNNGSQAGS